MQTVERERVAVASRGSRWPIVALVVMVVAALGLGSWWLVDEYTGIDRQIEVLVDDYTSAWSEGDGAGVVAMMTPTGRHVSPGIPEEGYTGDELATFVRSLDENFQFELEATGDPMIVEGPSYYLVMLPSEGSMHGAGYQFFRIVEYDGELLISYHEWIN